MVKTSILCLLLLGLPACTSCDPRVLGSGIKQTQAFPVDTFHTIEIGGVWSILVRQGHTARVEVTTDHNLFEHLSVRAEKGILTLRTTKNINPRTGLTVWIETPDLSGVRATGLAKGKVEFGSKGGAINISGKGKITAVSRGGKVLVGTSGAARITLEGFADSLNINASGGSWIHGGKLRVREASIKSSGATRATINAVEKLSVDTSGVASVDYYGKPKLKTSGRGTSQVHAVDKVPRK